MIELVSTSIISTFAGAIMLLSLLDNKTLPTIVESLLRQVALFFLYVTGLLMLAISLLLLVWLP